MTETANKITIDNAPLNAFHLKITGLTFGANFVEGYAIGIIAMALTALNTDMQLGPLWQGLLGASVLFGIFIGSIFLGGLSDRVGRNKIFAATFVIVAIASILQYFVNDPLSLLILRIIIGIALGGDYSVGTTLLVEFVPKKHRGALISSLSVVWTVGYVVSSFVGHYLANYGEDAWRWMLVSTAIPSILVLLLRLGTPESPRWLIQKGRKDEALYILQKYIHPAAVIDETSIDEEGEQYTFRSLFQEKYRKRTWFGSLFFVCIVIPYFAIYTFLPTIVEKIGFSDGFFVENLLNSFLIVGSIVGIWFTIKFSRRGFLISFFALLAVSLFLLTLSPSGSNGSMIFFAVFTFCLSAISNLCSLYISELFPTQIRGLGIGYCISFSRIGSAISTFLLPIGMVSLGMNITMLCLVAVLIIGMMISIAWAPETSNLNLSEASKGGSGSSKEGRVIV
ncbi:MFS transporter [Brevibacillus centrosporus]|uniref:MFS transporter n=1 Tax=Brevibacillus centrosporus TaxID=54910 RepID=UPI000F09B51B|nr:MFS transporter [Brevibacillus centrosporus]MEC2129653.1 MFS transporter [Brevibacillus centrosporus]RNB65749.1 MFS transporter [Brevibacillus centrosporus]GED30012.1 MFS transporter [Brevibacillus centrosporus]